MIEYLKKHEKQAIDVIFVFCILAAIKSIFTDTGYDNSYAVSMSFRHLNGDDMFHYMWEPHQTSIFVTDILMWLYHLIIPSYTGVMLYLQIVGTLAMAGISLILFKILSNIISPYVAKMACMFFFIFRVKQSPFLDYANLMICFSTLSFVFLVKYINNQKRILFLFVSGLFLCLEVLVYPSGALSFFAVAVALFAFTEKRWKNIGILTMTCLLTGTLYLSFFLIKLGVNQFLESVKKIVFSDSHQTDSMIVDGGYFKSMEYVIGWILISVLVAFLIRLGAKALKKDKPDFLPIFGILLCFFEVVMLFLQKKLGIDWTANFYILPFLLMVLGCVVGYKKMTKEEYIIWLSGSVIALSSFLAACLLSDLTFLVMLPYLVLGGTVSFIPFKYAKEQAILFLMAICAIAVIHRGLVVWGYGNKWGVWTVNELEAVVTEGPSLGIGCDYLTYYQTKCDIEDHKAFINKEDNVFLVGGYVIDSVEYLLTGGRISNCSTIDTPIYNETTLEYFEDYPEKRPDVVAVSCWYGGLMVDPESMIMTWVDENYDVVGDGRYWRYYRRKQNDSKN